MVQFEIPSDNVERTKTFYKELFGWNIENWPGHDPSMEGTEYLMITTTDEKGNKSLTGGMMKRQDPQQQGITNYIDVTSVDEYSTKIGKLGGKVVSLKSQWPEWDILLYVLTPRITPSPYGKQIALLNKTVHTQ